MLLSVNKGWFQQALHLPECAAPGRKQGRRPPAPGSPRPQPGSCALTPRGSPPTLRPHPQLPVPLTPGDLALVGGTLLCFGVKEEPEIARVPSALSSYSFKKIILILAFI